MSIVFPADYRIRPVLNTKIGFLDSYTLISGSLARNQYCGLLCQIKSPPNLLGDESRDIQDAAWSLVNYEYSAPFSGSPFGEDSVIDGGDMQGLMPVPTTSSTRTATLTVDLGSSGTKGFSIYTRRPAYVTYRTHVLRIETSDGASVDFDIYGGEVVQSSGVIGANTTYVGKTTWLSSFEWSSSGGSQTITLTPIANVALGDVPPFTIPYTGVTNRVALWIDSVGIYDNIAYGPIRYQGQDRALVIGDSISFAWPGMLEDQYSDWILPSTAFPGDTITRIAEQWQLYGQGRADFYSRPGGEPPRLIVMGGTNNCGPYGSCNYASIFSTLENDIYDQALVEGWEVFALTTIPGTVASGIQNSSVALLDDLIRAKTATNFTVLDTWALFDDGTGNGDPALYNPDGAHPNTDGNQLIVDLVAGAL